MGITAQRNGLSVASVAGKMSVVIPIIFGIIVYNEGVGFVKVIGILTGRADRARNLGLGRSLVRRREIPSLTHRFVPVGCVRSVVRRC